MFFRFRLLGWKVRFIGVPLELFRLSDPYYASFAAKHSLFSPGLMSSCIDNLFSTFLSPHLPTRVPSLSLLLTPLDPAFRLPRPARDSRSILS